MDLSVASASDPKRGIEEIRKRTYGRLLLATSLTFTFYLSKDCVCPLGCSLSRPLVATAGDGSEGVAFHSEDW